MNTRKASFRQPVIMLILFCVYTFLVAMVDFKPIGPGGSEVGFATVNRFFQQHLAYNDLFYVLSKILGYVCFIIPGINVALPIAIQLGISIDQYDPMENQKPKNDNEEILRLFSQLSSRSKVKALAYLQVLKDNEDSP